MAWTSEGFWKPDNSDDTQSQVASVVDAGGRLMKQAEGYGTMLAAKRGLGNSTLAAKSAQGAVLDRAIQIGGQTAAQNSAKNLAALNANEQLKYGTTLQQMTDAAAKERLGMQITSNEGIAGADRASNEALTRERMQNDITLANLGNKAAMERLTTQLGSDRALETMRIASAEKLNSQDIAAQMSRLSAQIASNEKLAAQGDQAAMARLQADLASRAQLQAAADIAALERQREEITARTGIADKDRDAELQRINLQLENARQIAAGEQAGATERQRMQNESALTLQTAADRAAAERQTVSEAGQTQRLGSEIAANRANAELDATTRLNLGQMDATTSRENAALNASTAMTAAYMQSMSALMANENIPANVRQEFQKSMQQAAEGNISLIEQINQIDLAWGNNPIVSPNVPAEAVTGGGYSTQPQSTQADGVQRISLPDGGYYLKRADGGYTRYNSSGNIVGQFDNQGQPTANAGTRLMLSA